MARVPGILQIGSIALNTGHAVALPAEVVELIGAELAGIARSKLGRVFRMRRGGSMTSFAANAQFVRCDYLVRRDGQWPRGMTAKAAQDTGFGIEDPMHDAARG